MPLPEVSDVLVIGAGPVGLTLASELKRQGVKVRIVEKKPEPIQHPNAAIVHVRTLEILSAMGAVDGFLREGYPLPGMYVQAYGHNIGFIDVGGIDSPYSNPRNISQVDTERLLNEHLIGLGVKIEREIEALSLEQDTNEARVTVRHLAKGNREEVLHARWVVGCEGSSSMVRQSLGIAFEGSRYVGKEFLQTDGQLKMNLPHGFGHSFITGEHIMLLFPYDNKGLYRIICARTDKDPENKLPPTLEEMQDLLRLIVDPAAELSAPRWFNRFRSGHRLATTFRQGRAFLAGDAGHVHIPIGGQGMNYGMHDAFNLGWKLASVIKGEVHTDLLDSYMEERHTADKALIQATDRGFHVMIDPYPVFRQAFKLLGSTLINLGALQKKLRNTLAEVNVSYPLSALTDDQGGSHGPEAGERAPDAILVRMPSRETAQLFDIFRGTHWTLLLFAGTEPTQETIESLEKFSGALAARFGKRLSIQLILAGEPPVPIHENWAASVIMDRKHLVHAKYGVEIMPCLYLIRPDWYIGFRGGMEHQRNLSNYLEKIFT